MKPYFTLVFIASIAYTIGLLISPAVGILTSFPVGMISGMAIVNKYKLRRSYLLLTALAITLLSWIVLSIVCSAVPATICTKHLLPASMFPGLMLVVMWLYFALAEVSNFHSWRNKK